MTGTDRLLEGLNRADLLRVHGRVIRSVGAVVEASGPPSFVGEICRIEGGRAEPPIPAEVVGFADGRVLLMPWESSSGLRPGAEVVGTGTVLPVETGDMLLGRVLDGLGRPIDGLGPLPRGERRVVRGRRLEPMDRVASREPFVTGVRSIDGLVSSTGGNGCAPRGR
jgi:flagellum-specific ATP synthase